jgi:hypothetical protein
MSSDRASGTSRDDPSGLSRAEDLPPHRLGGVRNMVLEDRVSCVVLSYAPGIMDTPPVFKIDWMPLDHYFFSLC